MCDKYNNADQTFWIFYILCVFGFLTQKKIKFDKKEKHSNHLKTNKQKLSKHARMITRKTTKQSHNI